MLYVLLMGGGAICSFCKVFVLGRFLMPAGFGHYSFLSAIVTYGLPLASLGIVEGMSLRLPVLLGHGLTAEAYAMRNHAMAVMAGAAAGAILITGLIAGAVETTTGRQVLLVSMIVVVEIYAYVAFSIGLRDIGNHLDSVRFAAVMATRGLVDLLASAVLARRYGYLGVLTGETLILIVAAIVIAAHWMPGFRIGHAGSGSVMQLIRSGLAVTLFGALANAIRLGDRIILGAVLPAPLFAVYSFHLIVISAGLLISNMLSQYAGPRALHLLGSSRGDRRAVIDYLSRLSLMLLIAGLCAGFFVPSGLRFSATHFFKGYPVDVVLLLVLYAAAVVDVANLFPLVLLTLGRLNLLLLIYATAAVVLLAGFGVAYRAGAGLVVFASIGLLTRLGTFAASAIASGSCQAIVFRADELPG